MLNNLIMQMLLVLVQIVVVVVLGAVISFLKKKIGVQKLNEYYDKVKKAVQAAEMIYGSNAGEEKKAWVLEYLSKALGKRLSSDDINMFIESAVHEMNIVLNSNGLGGTTDTTGNNQATPIPDPATGITADTSQAADQHPVQQ